MKDIFINVYYIFNNDCEVSLYFVWRYFPITYIFFIISSRGSYSFSCTNRISFNARNLKQSANWVTSHSNTVFNCSFWAASSISLWQPTPAPDIYAFTLYRRQTAPQASEYRWTKVDQPSMTQMISSSLSLWIFGDFKNVPISLYFLPVSSSLLLPLSIKLRMTLCIFLILSRIQLSFIYLNFFIRNNIYRDTISFGSFLRQSI